MPRLLLLCTGCIAWLAMCGSCLRHLPPVPPAQAFAAAVEITATCGRETWRASGVVIDPTTALTAKHALRCQSPTVVLTFWDGSRALALRGRDVGNADISELVLLGNIEGIWTPVAVTVVQQGDTLCMYTAHPYRERRCGTVESTEGLNVYHNALTLQGNSGAGVYDRRGRLVGIVRARYLERQGGAVTLLWGVK